MNWKEKLIRRIEKVNRHGWGGCEIKITSNGKRRIIKHWFTEEDVEEREGKDDRPR